MKLKKRKTVSQLKKDAWKLFSEWIRRRDADWKGDVSCVTCGIKKNWKRGDAGHFLPGRYNANLFEERGCHFQCKLCNGHLRNAPQDVDKRYRDYMKRRYGEKVIKELEAQNRTTVQFTTNQLEIFIMSLKDRLKKL